MEQVLESKPFLSNSNDMSWTSWDQKWKSAKHSQNKK